MDKNTVTKVRNIEVQLEQYKSQLLNAKLGADHPTDKHHLEKARKGLQQAQNHLKVAIVGLLDQVNREKVERGL